MSSRALAAFLAATLPPPPPLLTDAEVERLADEFVAAGVRALGVSFAEYLDHSEFGRRGLRLEATSDRCRLAERVRSMRSAFAPPTAPAGVGM